MKYKGYHIIKIAPSIFRVKLNSRDSYAIHHGSFSTEREAKRYISAVLLEEIHEEEAIRKKTYKNKRVTKKILYKFLNKERKDFNLWAGNYEEQLEKMAKYINSLLAKQEKKSNIDLTPDEKECYYD